MQTEQGQQDGVDPDPDDGAVQGRRRAGRDGRPVGRRVVLGMLALGGAGILVGDKVQSGLSGLLSPLREGGLGGLIPGAGGFTLYTVTNGYPAPPPNYHLHIGGLVDHPMRLSVGDLEAMPATRLTKTFQCVTGWVVDDVHWIGVRLTDLAARAGARSEATAFEFTSFDGVYTESLTRLQAEQSGAIVAYSMLGAPVTRDHGGPLRLYVPGMFGYKSIKWLSGVNLVNHAVPGYWEQNGYPVDGWIDGHPPAVATSPT